MHAKPHHPIQIPFLYDRAIFTHVEFDCWNYVAKDVIKINLQTARLNQQCLFIIKTRCTSRNLNKIPIELWLWYWSFSFITQVTPHTIFLSFVHLNLSYKQTPMKYTDLSLLKSSAVGTLHLLHITWILDYVSYSKKNMFWELEPVPCLSFFFNMRWQANKKPSWSWA
jgi:hypothetical protein